MRLISWNVNGVRAVEKRGDLQWLWTSDADIICFQETKVSAAHLPTSLTAPPGWKSEWCFGDKKGYSGTATFVRENAPLEVVSRGLGVDPAFDNEGRILATDHGRFILFNVYFPNGGRGPERMAYKMGFYEAFAAHVNALVASGRDVVICGDWNVAHREIDVALPERWSSVSGFLPIERAWFDSFLKSGEGWIDTFRSEHGDRPRQYSWWDVYTDARPDNVGWRIDYFVINQRLEESLLDAWISPHIMGSDHCPVGVELKGALAPRADLASSEAAADESEELLAEDEEDEDDVPVWRRR